ncbi:MAG TPA: sigma-54-dependent Fis family transcriptional regulator [Firmicutes bacterium]|nr:sigma-54-dependent Fis family transcriptional regulator [Bacillota bacterium]
MRYYLLVVDDEKNTREGLRQALERDDRVVFTAADGREALDQVQERVFDVVITDLRMPRMDGLQLLEAIQERGMDTAVILLSGYGTIETAVEAMRRGALDFITKPVNLGELELRLSKVLGQKQLALEHESLKEQIKERFGLDNMVGRSQKMIQVFETIRQIAPSKSTVLITGETGTGKELVAYAIHAGSPRKNKLFQPVNCAALPESLLESELFGHERGAFTGAVKQKKGYFEVADGGTVFLDEIGEISLAVQVKLLRILEQRQFERVGGTNTLSIDVRVVAATNADLEALVRQGQFREDLYYRLKVVTLDLPPLRERREDIPLLAETFLKQFAEENRKGPMRFEPETLERLKEYPWPGNVRELRHLIEQMVLLSHSSTLTPKDLPGKYQVEPSKEYIEIPQGTSLRSAERKIILQTLRQQGGNRTRTAEILGIGRRTLIRKLQEYGVGDEE